MMTITGALPSGGLRTVRNWSTPVCRQPPNAALFREDADELEHAQPAPQKKWWNGLFQGLQKMGRSLQLPIAVLPAAGILNRLGQPDVFGERRARLGQRRQGLRRRRAARCSTASSGCRCCSASVSRSAWRRSRTARRRWRRSPASSSTTRAARVPGGLPAGDVHRRRHWPAPASRTDDRDGAEYQNPGVFGGIVMGLLTAWFWQRYHRIKLVDWLGFFNGRRLVPIIMAFVGDRLRGRSAPWIWPPIGDGLTSFTSGWSDLGCAGAPASSVSRTARCSSIGLHQFLNTFVWFQFGDFTKPDGTVVHGDINRFLAGDPTAGQFTTGFFPIMMFALPGGGAGDRRTAPSRTAARRSAA